MRDCYPLKSTMTVTTNLNIPARIEPGAIIREQVVIGPNAVIMMGAMDNLVKGAAGQAVQNMNLMFGLPETEGLLAAPMFP